MATTPKIDNMTFAQLSKLHAQTGERMAALKEETRKELLRKMTEMAAKEGFASLQEVISPKQKKSGRKASGRTGAPKYANPSDPSQTWTGNGRAPRWLRDLEESGRKREEFLIP